MENRLRIAAIALLGVVGSPYDPPHLSPGDRPGAHDARLDGDVERTVGQVLAPERRGGGRQRLHLGMRRGVAQRLDQVVPAAHDPAARDDDRPDGHLLRLEGLARLAECLAHEPFVF